MTDDAGQTGGAAGGTIFLGDSLTAGGRWEEWFPDLEVKNFGRPGDTTTDVHDRLLEVVEAKPDTVVLMAGTNDVGMRAGVEQIVRGVEEILHCLHRDLPDARLVVQSLLPRERERAETIHQVNIHLRQFAPTVKADFVDLWPEFASEDGELKPEFTSDRLHLNESGYHAWVEQLRPALGA